MMPASYACNLCAAFSAPEQVFWHRKSFCFCLTNDSQFPVSSDQDAPRLFCHSSFHWISTQFIVKTEDADDHAPPINYSSSHSEQQTYEAQQ